MTIHNAIKAVVDAEPSISFAGSTNQEILDWFLANAEWADVPWLEFVIWLDGIDGMDRLEQIKAAPDGTSTNQSNQVEKSAARLGLVIVNSGQDLFLSRSEVRSSMSKLVENGRAPFFTTTERDSLLAKAQNQEERWRGFPTITTRPKEAYVADARALP